MAVCSMFGSQVMKMSVLLCLLLWSLVEVHSQTEFPYVYFMGETLANHSYVDLTLVGDRSDGSDNVQCHTDLVTCCNDRSGSHRGDWYSPAGDKLLFISGNGNIYEARDEGRIDLRRRNNANSPFGIYRCDIPTNAVHDENDLSVRDIAYVGLYATGGIHFVAAKLATMHLCSQGTLGGLNYVAC